MYVYVTARMDILGGLDQNSEYYFFQTTVKKLTFLFKIYFSFIY